MRTPRSQLLGPVLAVLAVLAAAPRPVGAAEPTPSELSVARRLFDEGKAASEAGRWREAAGKFRQATAIKDTPGIRFHLARCEEEQGALVEALVEYDRARELLDSGVKAPDVEKLLPEARERVKAKLGQIVLELPAGVAAVSVELDGKRILPSVLGEPLPVNPGSHRLRATAPGRREFSREVILGTGQTERVVIELPTSPVPPHFAREVTSAQATPPRDDGSGVSARAVTLVGEGAVFAAALTTGVVFTIKKSAASDRYDAANRLVLAQLEDPSRPESACRDNLEGCAQLLEADQDRSTAKTVSTIAFVAAGTSAAAFALTYWLWPAASAPVEVKASGAPGTLAVSLSGTF